MPSVLKFTVTVGAHSLSALFWGFRWNFRVAKCKSRNRTIHRHAEGFITFNRYEYNTTGRCTIALPNTSSRGNYLIQKNKKKKTKEKKEILRIIIYSFTERIRSKTSWLDEELLPSTNAVPNRSKLHLQCLYDRDAEDKSWTIFAENVHRNAGKKWWQIESAWSKNVYLYRTWHDSS